MIKEYNTKGDPIYEIDREKMLREIGLSQAEFVDLCILCGCDFVPNIEGRVCLRKS
jgi:flap endonuclease-1